ncbi:uncharacterized protein LOC122665846 [Telopea speciosissima]|uniref:uncharacterized protein LOC122665846 n=1 Tax=Telopea speciosissima TaxID=54955 RepID=UPI001CC377E2|nr:uncharacterized protein LOC122665846 [Telopea speciosissima]
MKKAYDKVEWDFLQSVLLKLGFSEKWVNLVLSCLKTVSYSLVINGAIKGKVVPFRGIRQRDPLSPALFILCSQALSAVIAHVEQQGLINGIRVKNRSEPMTHLLFTDDCCLFFELKLEEVCSLKDCVDLYCRASGQAINFKKSSVSFSLNMAMRFRRWFSLILKVSYIKGPSKYLGLPTDFGVSEAALFQELADKVGQRFSGWKNWLLSHAGKEIMLKSVALSMGNYANSHFKLPASHHSQIRKEATSFFWGDGSDKQKIHWIAWHRLCRSKDNSGLGFRDPELQNKVLLSRMAWRLWNELDSMWGRFMKAIYFPKGDFLSVRLGAHPSWA